MSDLKFAFRQVPKTPIFGVALAFLSAWSVASGEQRQENFGSDPNWHGYSHRSAKPVTVRQDFGWTPDTTHAGGGAGEIGGQVYQWSIAYDPNANGGRGLVTATLNGDAASDELSAEHKADGAEFNRFGLLNVMKQWDSGGSLWLDDVTINGEREDFARDPHWEASGKVCLRRGVSDSTSLIGFYHSTYSLQVNPSQQFATPKDFLGVAIEGPSSEGFYFYPVYRNDRHGAGNGAGASPPRIYPDSRSHDWTLEYDPAGARGNGTITVTLDGRAASIALAPGDKESGAQFDRFGLVTLWIDGNGQHIYFDELSYTSSHD